MAGSRCYVCMWKHANIPVVCACRRWASGSISEWTPSSPHKTCHGDHMRVPLNSFSTIRKAVTAATEGISYVVYFFCLNLFYSWHIDVSPQGWDLTAKCRVFRGHCLELHTSEQAQSSARCDPGKWPPTGAAAGGGQTAAPDSWLLGCPADRPPGVGEGRREEGGRVWDVFCSFLQVKRFKSAESEKVEWTVIGFRSAVTQNTPHSSLSTSPFLSSCDFSNLLRIPNRLKNCVGHSFQI